MVLRQDDPTVVEEMVVAVAGAEETASWVWAPPDALAHALVGGGDESHAAGERRDSCRRAR